MTQTMTDETTTTDGDRLAGLWAELDELPVLMTGHQTWLLEQIRELDYDGYMDYLRRDVEPTHNAPEDVPADELHHWRD